MYALPRLLAAVTALLILACPCPLRASQDPGITWPSSINHGEGFRSLGKVIRASPGFPASGSNIEQAKFVAQHLPEVALKYGLYPGTGSVLDNAFIGASRVFENWTYDSPENTAMLNGMLGLGDCAEWSYGFFEMLMGAGVSDVTVAFGDNNPNQGRSLGFTGTDTMVVLWERDPATGRYSRRVFDAFQAASNGPGLRPTAETVADWMDVALDACDRWKDEPVRDTWLKAVGKHYVKDSAELALLNQPSTDRLSPGKVNRPKPAPLKGRNWVLKDVKVYPADPMDTGPTWRHGSTQSADYYKYEIWSVSETDGSVQIDNKFEFRYDSPPALLMAGETITLTVKGMASIGPHTPESRYTNWGSYSVSGIPFTTTDAAYVGHYPDERGMITSAQSSITITVPGPGEGEDTVVIMEHYDKGILAEYTYKRGG